MAKDDFTPEEVEQAAREHVWPPERPVAWTHLVEGPEKFWQLLQEFGEQPLLQDLVQCWYGSTGGPEPGRLKRERLVKLVIAMSDLLEAASDHEIRYFTNEDTEMAEIMKGALSPISGTHELAMERFDAWLERHEQASLEEARHYAPGWIEMQRRRQARGGRGN